jgi:hypothetical protein
VTRTRLRIGAAATIAAGVTGLLFVWFESARGSLILVGSLGGQQLEALLAVPIVIAVCVVILSLARQLYHWRGRLGSALAFSVIAVTGLGMVFAFPLAALFGLLSFTASYTRLGPLDHGKEVVIEEISFLHSDFAVYRGRGILLDYVPTSSTAPPGFPILSIDHWAVDRSNGHYVISYATTPTGPMHVLFSLD